MESLDVIPESFLEHAVRSSLVDMLDKLLLVVLRDGRKLVGTLRTFDQYSNIVLQDTRERFFCGKLYSELPLGLYLIRGENIVMMGDLDMKQAEAEGLKKVSKADLDKAIEEEEKSGRKTTTKSLFTCDEFSELV